MEATYKSRIDEFLKQPVIAICGFSADPKQPANAIYQKLGKMGKILFAVNPRHARIGEVDCYKDLASLPQKPGAVMICTPPDASLVVVKECGFLGIEHIWVHRSIGNGSYHPDLSALARKFNLNLIDQGCPMMFVQPDIFHRCFRWLMDRQGKFKAA
jgi:predicted CoA-binding protein